MKTKKLFYLLSISMQLFIIFQISFSQKVLEDDFTEKELDSLIELFNELDKNKISDDSLIILREEYYNNCRSEIKQIIEINTDEYEAKEKLQNLLDIAYLYAVLKEPQKSINILDSISHLLYEIEGVENSSKNLLYLSLGELYAINDKHYNSIESLLNAEKGFSIDTTKQDFHSLYNNLIMLYTEIGNYSDAYEYIKKGKIYIRENYNDYSLSELYNNTADVHSKVSNYDSTKYYLIASIKLNLKYINKKTINEPVYAYKTDTIYKEIILESIANSFSNLGMVYLTLDNTTKAIKSNEIALKIKKRINYLNPFIDIASSFLNKGICQLKLNSLTQAKKYLELSLKRYKLNNDLKLLPSAYNYYAEYLDTIGNNKGAIDTLIRSLYYSNYTSNSKKTVLLKTHELLAKIYLEVGDTANAVKHFIKKDKIHNVLDIQKSSLKEKFMKRLTKVNNELNEEKKVLARNNRILLGLILFAFVLIVLIAILYLKIKNKSNKIKEKEKEIKGNKEEIEENREELKVKDDKLKTSNNILNDIMTDLNTHIEVYSAEKSELQIKRNKEVDSEWYKRKHIESEAIIKTLHERLDANLKHNKTINIHNKGDNTTTVVDTDGSVAINSTVLTNAYNKLEKSENAEILHLFKATVKDIQDSADTNANKYLEDFIEEYNKKKPNKSKLSRIWKEIKGVLPDIASIAEFGVKIINLFV